MVTLGGFMNFIERAKGLEVGTTTKKEEKKKNNYFTFLDRQNLKNIDKIASNFENVINAYANSVNSFYDEVKSRYGNRTFDYNDNYVTDSKDWLSSVQSRKDAINAEADGIRNYIDKYGKYFDETWVNSVLSSLNSNSKDLDNILKNAQTDADYWGNFESADAYNKWATKEKNYYNNWGKYADAEDFKYFSDLGNNIENPTYSDAIGWGHLHGIFTGNDYYFGGEKVNNKVTFVKENYANLAIGGDSNKTLGYLKYNQMTDEEVGVYNYLLAKYGGAKAEEYLNYLDNENLVNASLTQREAGELAQNIQNLESDFFKTLFYAGTSLSSGISQNIQNFVQFFQENARPTTQIEYINQYLQQDLTGAAKYLYQAGNTIGNMLPSIAISIATGGAGAALGSLQMGASAAGGAYAQAIKEGYSVGQARLYSTLVGAAEGGLQYALGGISKLGGKALSSVATKAAQIENVFLRVAAKTGLSLGGEILEEELQNFIEPLLKTIIMGEEYDAPTWSELLETAIVTAISTGVLEGASIAGYEVSAANNKKLYAGQEQQIVDRLLEIDADNVYAQRIKENLDKGKTLSGNQITQIIQQTFDKEVELKKQAAKYNRQIAKAEKQGLYPTLENFEVKDAERTTPTQDQETGYKLLEKPSSNKMGATTQNALKTDDYEGTELLDIEQPKAEQPKAEQQKNNVQAKSKVKAEDQPKTEAKTATTIEEVSKKYGKHATAMAKAYLPNQDVNEYAKAFDKVYEYAKSGASLSSIWKLLDIGVLTDTQVEIVYEMGDYASQEAAKEQDAKNKKLGDNKTRKKGVVAGDGVSIDELSKSFNDTQRKAYKTMQYIAEATGVNIVFFKSEIKDGRFVGEQGRYERAKKGTIFIDINAGLNNEMDVKDLSNYTMLRTFTHEFTHFIEDLNPQQYNELRKAVFERLEQQGVDVEALIEAQQSYGLSVEQASREVVAEAMADILPDSTFIETLANKHKNIFEKLLDKLKEFLANIKAYFESINKNSPEQARAMKESVGESVRYVENIVKLFDKAAIGAVENLQKVEQQQAENKVIEDLNSKGIAIDKETDTAVMLSARHAPKTEEEIETAAQNIQKALGVTIQEARQWVKDEVSIANLILNDKYAEYLDYDFDGRRAAIQKNSDFPQGTADFSNLCPKRTDYTNTMNKVLKNFPNRIITAEELAQIRQIMVEEGIEVACGVCYVEDRRQNDTKVADSFINDLARYRQGETTHEDGKPFNAKQLKAFALMGEESYTPNLYELVTREGLNKLSREHKSVAEAWNIYNNARGMQAVRLIQNESEYKREILKYSKDKVRRINNAGGLRIFSFSDFTEYHLIDIIQIIQDCAVMGIKIQGYTKVPAFAKLVEKTGVKLNRSLIPKGELGYHLENGKVVLDYDRTEGIDIEDENFVDTTDNPDVGNIVIGINDEQISAAMLDDFIDYIIPFHTGQSKEVLRIKKLATWNNYKDFQTDKDIETGTTAKKQVNIYTDVLNAAEKEGKPITNKVEFVNKYLKVCKEKGLKPRFWQFLNKDANGDYSYREGYHKLLLDFKMFDKNGNILPQKPVTPNFDAAFMMDLLKEYAETKAEKSKTLAPKLEKVYERITKEILTDDAVQYQRRENLTNREILELMTVSFNAEEMSQLTDAELDALEIFKKQTTEIYELQEMRLQEGAVFVENQFKKDGDRKLAQEAKNRVAIIDEKIKKATDRLMQIQEAEVIKKILPKARKIVGRYERIQTKQLASQYRKETREKINEVKEKAKAEKFDALARYRERMQNAATIKKYKERIEADVKELTKWIVSPDNKNYLKHVPDVLKDAVVPFLESIDFTSKRQLRGGEETIADKKFVKQLNTLMKAFKGTTDVEKMYSGYYDLPADFIENLQYFIDATQDLVGSVGGEYIINKMTAEELASLSKIVRALKHFIPQVNKFHNNAMYQHVYEAGDETISTLKKIKTSIARALDNFLFWKNTRPMDGFERMGKGARSIFLGLEKGQEQLAKNTKEIIDFTENAYTEKEVKEWEKELHTIEIEENGEKVTFQMTTSQIMGFYCLANQQDSLQHMDNGGIRIPTMKIKRKKYANEEHKVSRKDIKNIISKLTDRQKAVADKLQKYMATKGAEWGNYVSVARFGEKLFTNPDYYPINSDGRHLESMADKELSAASLYALLNMSFTKSRNQLANNTILVYSIFDVFANHMASMAQYNAMALPVLDAIKWLNYEQKDITAEGKRIVKGSVKAEMDRAFGVPEETKSSGKMGYAQSFVSNIIKSFNGTESFSSANDSLGLKALHIYNRAQIAFNLRVVIQQPLSIVRAGQVISYKSILKGLKASPKQAKANVEEMLKHSGIALWKSLGFYDVNVSRGLTSLIKHDETFIDKVTEAGMFLAEKADERTWAAMWSACKEEIIAKGTAPTDAKFFDKVNELFAEVIHKTQVVDSTLTKTEYMRDKGFFPRAMSSFMSEPITSASMAFNAFFNYRTDLQRGMSPKQAWENNKNNIARTVVVYGLSQTLLAVVQSFQDAARDDDDYETYLQKFGEALKSNVVDEVSLLGKIPVVKNLLEFAKEMLATWTDLDIYGNEPPTVFAQWWDGFVKGSEILHDKITGEDTNYTTYSGIFKLLQGVSGIVGLPIANITREIVTLWNNTVGRFAPSLKVKSYDAGEKNSIKYAYFDGYLSEEEAIDLLVKQGMDKDDAYFFIQKEGKYDALYESILSGEGYAEAVEHLTEHGVTMDNITSTARNQIHKWLNEATITKDKAIELLVTYGELKKDVAQSRVEFWVVKHENNLEGFTEAAYNKYLKECAKSGMDVKVFYNAWQYKNEVDDKRKTLDYIYTLDIPQNQKRALIMCFY